MPWITKNHTVRVGAAATFTGPVVLDYRNSNWKLQPTGPVTGLGEDTVTFAQTRSGNTAPANVGGDLKLGTFNVLNYFPTTGQDFVALGGGRTCTYFNDRAGNPVTNNSCNPQRPPRRRRAPRTSSVSRPRSSPRSTPSDADIVSLEEIENSVQFGKDRDDAVSKLVDALNAAAGAAPAGRSCPSPAAADLPALAEQDVIRTAFIYDPSTVSPGRCLQGPRRRGRLRQRPRAAGPGLQGQGHGRRRRVRRHRQPLQVQGLRHRRRHRAGQRQPGPRRAGDQARRLRRRVQVRPRHHQDVPDR